MSDKIGIIDITTSAIRGLSKGLSSLYGVQLKEFPSIISEPVIIPKLVGSDTDLISLFHLNHSSSSSSGFVALFLAKDRLKSLLTSPEGSEPTEEMLVESWGELSEVIVGALKMELKNMGHDTIEVSSPVTYKKGVNITIEKVDINQKYNLSTEYDGKSFVDMQIAFQSLTRQESLQA